jgi:hypothetical protein
MLGQFDVRGVNVLDVLSIALFAGAAVLVLARGRRAAWAVRAAVGLGLLALARFGGILALQWLLWERQTAMVEKVRTYGWMQASLWLVTTGGIVLLVVAVLTQRREPEAHAASAPYAAAQAE